MQSSQKIEAECHEEVKVEESIEYCASSESISGSFGDLDEYMEEGSQDGVTQFQTIEDKF
jgi:hypothetical protein